MEVLLLPLLEESVNSPAMVRHGVKIVKLLVSKLNPGQFTVITGNQPVYTLGKQIQWKHTDECKDVLWMMGPLHIEMAFMSAIGYWLEGSGWVEIFERGNDFTLTRVESFLYGNKVKLEAANNNYAPINVDIERLIIQGKLIAVWRRT